MAPSRQWNMLKFRTFTRTTFKYKGSVPKSLGAFLGLHNILVTALDHLMESLHKLHTVNLEQMSHLLQTLTLTVEAYKTTSIKQQYRHLEVQSWNLILSLNKKGRKPFEMYIHVTIDNTFAKIENVL